MDFSWAQTQDFSIFEPKAVYWMFQSEAEHSNYRDERKLMNTNESGLKKLAEHLVTIQDHHDEDHYYWE